MRMMGLIAATSTLLAACGSRDPGPAGAPANESLAAAEAQAPAPGAESSAAVAEAGAGEKGEARRWDLQSSGEGVALALMTGDGAAIRFFCPAGGKNLLVNVPGFKAIGSEERLSFGGGGDSSALVADTRGDRQRGGVSGTGAVPGDLADLIDGPVSASYGAQRSGPHP
ncbi:MAG: hypothetical protein WBR13_12815, partial [Allosphingosinicella sp.]